ncbi:MAG: tRNA nucleotidyltransferase [Bacteroidetes bacterium HGW-Bacteroidetes-21]|jgi:poly(A) polymerase|nr:MAG: tRNA nucleotidyltransferase [Bacteroidetes bacterium HGW-Bacteroidetes-21]
MEISSVLLSNKAIRVISEVTSREKATVYVVGGYVRDMVMKRKTKDIDILVIGSGIEIAEKVAAEIKGATLNVFKSFGTAQVKFELPSDTEPDKMLTYELEFVGARKESYNRGSRKPIVENGNLEDDLNRRDFTINTLVASLMLENFGEIIDRFEGILDIEYKILRTPLDPDITFSDDPLRMMRAIRFASQLGFTIEAKTLEAISRNASRLEIVSTERITDEFNKILLSETPSVGLWLMEKTGLMNYYMPELLHLKGSEYVDGKGHKDNFSHTLQVVDKIRTTTDNIWLIWTALLHDIGKPATRMFQKGTGWTFHGHEIVGSKMASPLFKRLRLPLGEPLKYLRKLISLHLRPAALTEEIITDSAVRRLLFEAGDDINDLMLLAEADITSKNKEKVTRYLTNFAILREKLQEVEENDRIRNWQPPVSGEEIMQVFSIPPCKTVGDLKNAVREAILNGEIKNDPAEAWKFIIRLAGESGLSPKENLPPFNKIETQ